MTSTPAQPQQVPPPVAILQLMNGGAIAGAVACLAQLGIPDLVEKGPKSAEELAIEIGANPDALFRLMRATACVGVLTQLPDGKFAQTPISDALRTNAVPSMRAAAIMQWRDWYTRSWSLLDQCVRTGGQAPEMLFGRKAFEFFQENPAEGAIFDGAMTSLSAIDSPAVADAYSFDGINSIVDIAGGHGLLLATILARNPHMNGTLYDMPHVVEGAKNGPLKAVDGRYSLAGGDMFRLVPSGADAYIMKHIIHDWNDEYSLKILRACRAAVNPGGKLLVVDGVIQPGNDFSPAKFLDLNMLIFVGGHERSEEQFRKLFDESGWKLNRIIPTAAVECIVEGVPA